MIERRQFRVLYRAFLSRLIDFELLSARGQVQTLLVQFAAMLAAFNFVVAVMSVPAFGLSRLPPERLAVAARGAEHFLIVTTMAIVGLFAVLAWNNLLPDRYDALVLGTLPVRSRTMLRAKLAAIGAVLGTSVIAVNSFTGLTYPFIVYAPGGGVLRSLAAYWITMTAAGASVFCSILAAEGLAAQLLSYRLFLRVSSFLQLVAFFTILGGYFLTPPARNLPEWLPSFWFLALFQELMGVPEPAWRHLAWRAIAALSASAGVAALAFGLSFHRSMRRIVEQPDITPADRSRPAARAGSWIARKVVPKPLERAILLFTARSIARSRQHRMLLAAYGGIGLAIALAYLRSLVYGKGEWSKPGLALLMGSFVLLFFSAVGTRAIFALPLALRANWIFRIAAVHSPSAYFTAVRKAMMTLAAGPVCVASAIVYLALWPTDIAVKHLMVLFVMGVLLVYLLLFRFRKIPFTCSYLPGKADLRVKLGTNAILFMFLSDAGVRLEFWAMERPGRFAVVLGLLVASAVWAHRRTVEFARSRYLPVQFEEVPPADVMVLGLQNDDALSGNERYVDA